MTGIFVKADWNDQGWGNAKAELVLSLVRDGTQIRQKSIFGVYKRDGSQKYAEFGLQDAIVAEAMPGDLLAVKATPGGGGGHKINVNHLEVMAVTTHIPHGGEDTGKGCCQISQTDPTCAHWEYADGWCVELSSRTIGCNK